MDTHDPANFTGEASGFQSGYSAVLQEIFEQTQTEIQARNQHIGLQFVGPTPLLDAQNDTFRYEPLLDPALSYISNILADDDDSSTSHPCLSLNEFVAYQAKAMEVAAILKEDSPTLTLRIEPQSPEYGVSNSFWEDLQLESSNACTDVPSPISRVSESVMNEMLLNSLRGPVSHQEISFSETAANDQIIKVAPSVIQDDIGVGWHAHRPHKPQKTEKVLKPRRESAVARKRSGSKHRSSRDVDHEFVDINDLLQQCAQAVGVNNSKRAVEILNKVKQHASPYGNGAERLAYYFAEAMDARFSNTGWPLYLGLLCRRPSSAEILKATYMYMASCPFVKAYHYFINQTILNVASGASKLHIMELQVTGFQYPSLFKALADRPGGPPQVHLIGIGFPHYSMLPACTEVVLEGVQKTGRQLSDYAASCGVPFQYTPWAGTRDELCMKDFVSPHRNADEVLVVISAYMLRYVMDDNVDTPTVRSKLLKQGRDINPDVYIQGIVTGSYSTPFFTRRFKEALFHFESVFDMLDTFIDKENQDRIVFESEILGKAILNIVACEGTEVMERVDKYKHWQAVTEEVGFQQLPLNEEIKKKVQVMLKTWHKEYTVAEDSQYLLMGWKARMLHAMSTWKATPESASNQL